MMKTKMAEVVIAFALLAGACSGLAAEKHAAGPKGGRLLEKSQPRAEFFLEKDHTVTITFYDAALKPVPATDQSVSVIADSKDGKQKVEFEKKGDVLVSKGKLPQGDGYDLVVQLRENADAKPQNFRFKLETHECAACKRPEYACICDE